MANIHFVSAIVRAALDATFAASVLVLAQNIHGAVQQRRRQRKQHDQDERANDVVAGEANPTTTTHHDHHTCNTTEQQHQQQQQRRRQTNDGDGLLVTRHTNDAEMWLHVAENINDHEDDDDVTMIQEDKLATARNIVTNAPPTPRSAMKKSNNDGTQPASATRLRFVRGSSEEKSSSNDDHMKEGTDSSWSADGSYMSFGPANQSGTTMKKTPQAPPPTARKEEEHSSGSYAKLLASLAYTVESAAEAARRARASWDSTTSDVVVVEMGAASTTAIQKSYLPERSVVEVNVEEEEEETAFDDTSTKMIESLMQKNASLIHEIQTAQTPGGPAPAPETSTTEITDEMEGASASDATTSVTRAARRSLVF